MDSSDSTQATPIPWAPQFTGAQSAIHCMDCNNPLGYAMVAGFKIACCEQCHGMLFQRDTLGPTVNRCRSEWRKLDCEAVPLDQAELARRTNCPACGDVMETHPYIGPGCVAIDSCSHCDLIWLNGGELDRVVQSPGKRKYAESDLERTEFSFIKPAASFGNEQSNKPPQLEDRVYGTLLELITALGL